MGLVRRNPAVKIKKSLFHPELENISLVKYLLAQLPFSVCLNKRKQVRSDNDVSELAILVEFGFFEGFEVEEEVVEEEVEEEVEVKGRLCMFLNISTILDSFPCHFRPFYYLKKNALRTDRQINGRSLLFRAGFPCREA